MRLAGLAAAVYRTASLTGRWLGTPAWWWVKEYEERPFARIVHWSHGLPSPDPEPRQGWVWASPALIAIGLELVAISAWPRRSARPAVGST